MHPKLFSYTIIQKGLLLAGLFGVYTFATAQVTPRGKEIAALIDHQSFFMADDLLRNSAGLEPFEELLFHAELDNAFNRLESSNERIAAVRQHYSDRLSDSVQCHLLELRQSNYARLYDYRNAAATLEELLDHYSALLREDEIANFRNTQLIWSSLADAPKQEVIVSRHTELRMERDKAQLWNLDVRRDSVHIGFIFDTGANISTVTETTAKRLNMQLIDAGIEVGAITGLTVQSRLAICPEFHLGDLVVKNAVFLVFPDSALAISQIDYQINGIIGFPVIEAFKTVQLTRDGRFIVPLRGEPSTAEYRNRMALHFLTPIIELEGESYTFDSGAASTMLYKRFYDTHRHLITKRNRQRELELGGAGGVVKRKGHLITWKPVLNGKKRSIVNVMVFVDQSRESETNFYGNIGQDVIGKFEMLTLDFGEMFVAFE